MGNALPAPFASLSIQNRRSYSQSGWTNSSQAGEEGRGFFQEGVLHLELADPLPCFALLAVPFLGVRLIPSSPATTAAGRPVEMMQSAVSRLYSSV